jgi:hypothetical protein
VYREAVRKCVAETDDEAKIWLLDLMYTAIGLAGEAGEFCNKVKKILRDHDGKPPIEVIEVLQKELEGVLWYWSGNCTNLSLNTAAVAKNNLATLKDRADRGVIKGSGDNR